MTDIKSVLRFLLIKKNPTLLWNACDFVLKLTLTIEDIPGIMNTAVDFLSQLETDPTEKFSF